MEQFIHEYFTSGSPLITAVALFLLYILLAKIADIFLGRVFVKVTKFTKSELDDRIMKLLHLPFFFTIIFLGAVHAINILDASDTVVFYSRGALLSIITLMWALFTIRASTLIIDKSFQAIADVTGLSSEVTPLIENIWKVIIIVGSIMIVLGIWEVDITPLLASAGIAGVAIALAAKDTLANFFGGISIFIDKPYKISDYIVLDQGERGEVVNIGIRSTRIKTRDDILISIPNSLIANTKIINESAPVPNFRFRVPVSVAYGSDIESVEKILIDIAHNNDNVISNPEPRVRFRAFGESSLNFELLCWAKDPSLRGKAIHEMNKEIYRIFNRENITIPFPHRTIYVREEKNWEKP
jgi:small-conductance mechanosensitive channel